MAAPNKLSADDVKKIVSLYIEGLTTQELAALFGVSHVTILYRLRATGTPTRRRSYFRPPGIVHTPAVQQTKNDLAAGRITRPNCCSVCSKITKPVAHHDDYNKPKDIRWLCPKCHHKWHRTNQAIPYAGNHKPRIRRRK